MRCIAWAFALCRHHGFELEILLRYSHRFLTPAYIMFDCSGMAFSKGNLKRFVSVSSSGLANRTVLSFLGVLVPALADCRHTGCWLSILPNRS